MYIDVATLDTGVARQHVVISLRGRGEERKRKREREKGRREEKGKY
jgi:hypothetical protein